MHNSTFRLIIIYRLFLYFKGVKTTRRALYFYVHRSSFVRKDADIFSSFFQLHEFDAELSRKWFLPIMFIRQFLFLLLKGFSADVFICQFSAYHSFLPALFGKITGKKVLIISGGNDAVSFPSIGYGNFYKPILRVFTTWSYKLCTMIIPKHESLWRSEYTYSDENPPVQGIMAFIPKLKCDHLTITNGYDGNLFFKTKEKKAKTFLTVTGAMSYPFQQYLKGIDLILAVAKRLPECTFTIIGVENETDFPDRSENISILKKVKHSDLISIYSEHTFYLQLSMAEGFPNALCESMLCECVPIGSNVFSIPEIVADTGFILKKRDVNELEEVIRSALYSDTKALGEMARQRILSNFPIEKRKKEFRSLFEMLKLI